MLESGCVGVCVWLRVLWTFGRDVRRRRHRTERVSAFAEWHQCAKLVLCCASVFEWIPKLVLMWKLWYNKMHYRWSAETKANEAVHHIVKGTRTRARSQTAAGTLIRTDEYIVSFGVNKCMRNACLRTVTSQRGVNVHVRPSSTNDVTRTRIHLHARRTPYYWITRNEYI